MEKLWAVRLLCRIGRLFWMPVLEQIGQQQRRSYFVGSAKRQHLARRRFVRKRALRRRPMLRRRPVLEEEAQGATAVESFAVAISSAAHGSTEE